MRVKILASAVPLVLAAAIAGGEFSPGERPCISFGETTLQIATAPWQNQFHVSFTADPRAATVRVQIVDRAELADFAVIDDIDTAEADSCSARGAASFVSIAEHPNGADPVIYLSAEGGANYRVFVQSRKFTAQDAAALIVGANRNKTAPKQTAAL